MCTVQPKPFDILLELDEQSIIYFPINLSEKANGKKKVIPPDDWTSFTESKEMRPTDLAYGILTGKPSLIFVLEWDMNS